MAIATAQAADLPGKAAPAEYVRVCDTYGAGFFFIPGTDTCLRIGGNVSVTYAVTPNAGNSITAVGTPAGSIQLQNIPLAGAPVLGRSYFDQDTSTSVRATLTFDARSNTEYGLLRSFIQVGFQRGGFTGSISSQGLLNTGIGQSPNASGLFLDRAFIQFAGFTFGHAASFFNFYQGDLQLAGNLALTSRALPVLAYTASFGSGFSATISLENNYLRRFTNDDAYILGATAGQAQSAALTRVLSSVGGLTYAGQQIPDIVANLRVDQGWGSLQLMGALHQLRDYGFLGRAAAPGFGAQTPGQVSGSPTNAVGDRWGYAVGAGLRLNLDMIARGNVFWLQGVFANGAVDYVLGVAAQGGDRNSINGPFNGSQRGAFSLQVRDAIVADVTGTAQPALGNARMFTTSAWSIGAGFRHFWTPALRSSIFGSYLSVDQPGPSLADFQIWQVGVNTIWSPVRNLDLGAEVIYGSMRARTNVVPVQLLAPNGKTSQDAWLGTLRVTRNF